MGRSEVLRGSRGKPEAELVSLGKILEALQKISWIKRIVVTKSNGVLDHRAVDLIIYLDEDIARFLGFETVCIQAKSGNGGGYRFVNRAVGCEGRFVDTRLMPLVLLVTNHQTSELIVNQLLLQLAWAGSWFRRREVIADEILAELLSLLPTPFLTMDIPLSIWEMEQMWNDEVEIRKKNNGNGGKNKKGQRGGRKRSRRK